MVKAIVGEKGSGKTKKLMEMAEAAANESGGNVIVIEKGDVLRFSLRSHIRLIDISEYGVNGYRELLAFLSGLLAGDYDITDIFVDSTFKFCGNNMDELSAFVDQLSALAEQRNITVALSLSATADALPKKVQSAVVA